MKKIPIALLWVALSLAASMLLYSGPEQDTTDESPISASNESPLMLFADDIRANRFNESGELTTDIKAGRILQRQGNEYIQMQSPEVRISEAMSHWLVRAKNAQLGSNNKIITLRGDVVLKSESDQDEIELTTAELIYDQRSGFISTSYPVTMVSNTLSLTAVGMNLDLNTQEIEFVSNVRTAYVPQSN